jgi:hypothetical protein
MSMKKSNDTIGQFCLLKIKIKNSTKTLQDPLRVCFGMAKQLAINPVFY